MSGLGAIASSLNATLLPLLNGNSSDIQTQSYAVFVPPTCSNSTVYYTGRPICIPQGAPTYYVAEESLLITLPNIGNVTAALAGATGIKGIGVSGVSAKLSAQQQTEMMQQALSAALQNATSQATALASGSQLELVNMTVLNGYLVYPVYNAAGVAAQASANQTFFAGRATVTKSIYIVFSMH